MTPTQLSPDSGPLGWPSLEVIAREIRRAMLDNPTGDSFNERAEKREAIANEAAGVIMARFCAALTAQAATPKGREAAEAVIEDMLAAWVTKKWHTAFRTDCERLVAAAQSTNAAQPAWQPIKTAPKDKPIMLCVTGFMPCTGRWWPIDSCWTSFDWEGHFESDAECTAYVNGCSYEPTHWMPMPAGPSLPSTTREAP